MSELRHTPGPWETEKVAENSLSIIDSEGSEIVSTYNDDDIISNVDINNARLISVAPEMLDEAINDVKSAIKVWDANWEDCSGDNWRDICRSKCLEANNRKVKLIEKATGLPIEEVLK